MPKVYAEECVILLHGLIRSGRSMGKMEKALHEQGYIVVNVDYPSRKSDIAVLAQAAVSKGVEKCQLAETTSINFVTHSMGGILVRYFLSENEVPELKRVVMLGPPNRGSELVDSFSDWPGYRKIGGPAGRELGTSADSVPNALGPVDFPLGIIAGTRSTNFIASWILPGEDDGRVTVERARVEGMQDFIEMPVTHTFMMRNDEAIQQVINFLETGRFDHSIHR